MLTWGMQCIHKTTTYLKPSLFIKFMESRRAHEQISYILVFLGTVADLDVEPNWVSIR